MNKYEKTLWADDNQPSISAEKLNKIEQGIDDVTNEVMDLMNVPELDGKDLNDIRDRGSYVARTSTVANTVVNRPETSMESGFLLEVFDNNGTAIIQRVTSFSPGSPDVFHRAFNSGNWGAWSKLPSDILSRLTSQVIYPSLYSDWQPYSPNFTPLTLVRDGKRRTLYGSLNGTNATNKYICGIATKDRPTKHLFAPAFVNDGEHMVGQLTVATNGDINVVPFKHSHIAINISWYVD